MFEAQFPDELETFYEASRSILRLVTQEHCSETPAQIVRQILEHRPICKRVCLTDIRNLVVFEALARYNVILDTYFDRTLLKMFHNII